MVRMFFRRKQNFDYGRTVGRLYRYGKGQVAIFVTKGEEKDKKLLRMIRRAVKKQMDPRKKEKRTFATLEAREVHNRFDLAIHDLTKVILHNP